MPNRARFKRFLDARSRVRLIVQSLPFDFDPASYPDGPLPSFFYGGGSGWTISAGKVVNSIDGDLEKFNDGSFEGSYASGLSSALSKGGSPIVSESSDSHSGQKAQQFTATASTQSLTQTIYGLTIGSWVVASVWGKRLTTLGTGTARPVSQAGGGAFTDLVYTRHPIAFRTTATSKSFNVIREEGTLNFDTYVVDDATFKQAETQEVFRVIASESENVRVTATITSAEYYAVTGVVARVDSLDNPLNYLVVYRTITNIYLDKVVNGVATNLINSSTAFTGTETLGLWVRGNEASIYRNGGKIGATQTVPDTTDKFHGYFSVGLGGNKEAALSVIANPF